MTETLPALSISLEDEAAQFRGLPAQSSLSSLKQPPPASFTQHAEQQQQQQQQLLQQNESFAINDVPHDVTADMGEYLATVQRNLDKELAAVDRHLEDSVEARPGVVAAVDELDAEFERLFNRPVLLPEESTASHSLSLHLPHKKSKLPVPELPTAQTDTVSQEPPAGQITRDIQQAEVELRRTAQLTTPLPTPYVAHEEFRDVELETSLFGYDQSVNERRKPRLKLPSVDECEFDKSYRNDYESSPEQPQSQATPMKVAFTPTKPQRPLDVDKTPRPQKHASTKGDGDETAMLKSRVQLLERKLEFAEFTSQKLEQEKALAVQECQLLTRELERYKIKSSDDDTQHKQKLREQLQSRLFNSTKAGNNENVNHQQRMHARTIKTTNFRSTYAGGSFLPKKTQLPFVVGKSTQPSYSVAANIQQVRSQLKAHDPNSCELCSGRRLSTSGSKNRLNITREDFGSVIAQLEHERNDLNKQYEQMVQSRHKYGANDQELKQILNRLQLKSQELLQTRSTQEAHGGYSSLGAATMKQSLNALRDAKELQRVLAKQETAGHVKACGGYE